MKYRGYDITQMDPYTSHFSALDPDADYDYGGDPGAYFQCNGMPPHSGKTLEDVKAEIDIYYEELD